MDNQAASDRFSEGWYQTIVHSSPDAIIVMDQAGRVVEWSQQAEEMFGWSRDEACGRVLESLVVPVQYRQAFRAGLERYRKSGEGPIFHQHVEVTALTRHGREFPVEVSVSPTRVGETLVFCGYVRSLETRFSGDARSRQRAIESRLFQQATLRGSAADTFEAAVQDCVDIMCSITGWPVGHALVPTPEEDFLQSAGIWYLEDEARFGEIRDRSRNRRFASGEGLPGRIWEAGETVWSSEIGDDPRFDREFLAGLGLRGVFGYPVVVEGEPVAVLEFLTAEEVAPDPQLLMQVSSLSTQLARTVEKRRWEQERMRLAAIVDSSCDAIISKTTDGTIVSWNEGAELVYGYTAEEAIGQSISIILPDTAFEEEQEIRDAMKVGRRLSQFETVRRHKSGRTIPVAITISPTRDAQGRFIGSSTIERDISERQRRERELQQAKEQAEGANRTKSEFLANISHELRTPMNAIIGMIDLSLGEELDPSVRDYLQTARDSADTLLYLLNDLLDFSRMEAGRLELDEEPFSLREIVDNAMKTLSLRAHEKGLELACRIGSQVPDRLMGDGHRLRQVILNLVTNAIKFTEQGEVIVSINVRRHGSADVELDFAIQDTGIGIPAEDRDRIFRPFTQLDSSTTRQHTGAGLGLSICQELIQKMGGTLTLESAKGRGSTFSFVLTFPVLADTPAHPASVPDLTGLPVLVVDDNETNRTILEETLSNWQMRPTVIANGEQAIDELRRAEESGEKYELLIVDALMPKMDGFSLIERLEDEGLSETAAVLMLSSADRQTFKERCEDLEIAAYLEKPISQSDMLDAVVTALRGGRIDETVIERMQQAPRPLNILLAEDTPANQKVVQAILQKRGHCIEVAHNGREAIERHRKGRFDLILMDVQMPTMDGLQATEAIRGLAEETKSGVPIIAMTAHARREDRLRCLEAGMDAYIAKPIDAQHLLEIIESARRRHPRRPIGRRRDSDGYRTGGTGGRMNSLIDRDAALARMGGSEELFRDMIRFFLEDAPGLLDSAENGIRGQNSEETTRAAHSLKGLAANFDARQTMDAAARLEEIGRSGDLGEAGEALLVLRRAVRELSAVLKEQV